MNETILDLIETKRQRLIDVVTGNGIELPHTLDPTASVGQALKIIDADNRGAVIVADKDGSITGIVSERDVVRYLAREGAEVLGWPVERIMTKDVSVQEENATCQDVLMQMIERRFRNMPVCRADGTFRACVDILDIVNAKLADMISANRKLLELLVKVSREENFFPPDTPITAALCAWRENKTEYFIVRDGENILGFITPDELLKALYRNRCACKET